jgi:hypothetical protein
MIGHVKTLVTLAVLAALLLFGLTWGWSSLTSPFPTSAPQKACYPTTVGPGDRVSAPKVTVSVYNASQRVGLAESTISAFENQGFGPGQVGNAPKGSVVPFAQVWTRHPGNPAVRLVASRLGPQAHVVAQHYGGPGVVVVVGNAFQKLVPGLSSVKVTSPATICSPPTS